MGQMTYLSLPFDLSALSFKHHRIEVPMHIALRRFMPLVLLAPSLAFAHPSPDHALSFASGITHPFGGLDHLLAMVAVGMLGARLKGHALWILPLAFMSMLTIGALIGIGASPSAVVEVATAGSVVAFGALLAVKHKMNIVAATIVVGTFALAHGYAHGVEADVESGASYLLGILLASAALHAMGAAVAMVLTRKGKESVLQIAGLAFALIGGAFLIN